MQGTNSPTGGEAAGTRWMTLEERPRVARRQWFALRVKARSEKTVAAIAREKGYEEFLPVYQCHRRWSDRVKLVELPLFPGYVLCRLEAENRLPLLKIPDVLHFVSIGRNPIPVEDTDIEAIQTALRSGLSAQPCPYLEVGQRVRLEQGPLAGLEGILAGVKDQKRIVVSVTLLRKSFAVEIDRQWVRAAQSGGSSRDDAPELEARLSSSSGGRGAMAVRGENG